LIYVNCDEIYLGWTPVHWSSVHGMKWLTEHLIKRGANLRIQTHLGVSAIDCTNAFDRSQASIAVLKKGEVELIHHLRFMKMILNNYFFLDKLEAVKPTRQG